MCPLCLNVSNYGVPILDFKHPAISRAAAGVKGRVLRTRSWETLGISGPERGPVPASGGKGASWSENASSHDLTH
jgi:hypothetical protein